MEEKLRILLCEDDESLGMLLREYLQAKGYEAELFPDGDAGYKAFLKNRYEMCVLDVMMPKKDGFQLAQEIRQVNAEIPIIFLTAKNLKEDIFDGFKIGADDYITKPFSMEELVFRMEAILRRVRGKKVKETNMYKLGRFTFDTQRQILAIGDKQTKLTTKESELLSLLCAHANDVLQRELALKTIWIDDNYFNARSMDVYITKPFSMEELTFRIEAILRRVRGKKNKESSIYKIGKFTFDTQKQILSTPEKQTKLTTKESELLGLLCAHANEILQRDFALKTIWIDDNYFNARSMDVYITKLRKHLKEDESIEIINIHGKGYKLITPEAES